MGQLPSDILSEEARRTPEYRGDTAGGGVRVAAELLAIMSKAISTLVKSPFPRRLARRFAKICRRDTKTHVHVLGPWSQVSKSLIEPNRGDLR
jgi:hypothetical protein